MFTGITGFILAFFFMLAYAAGVRAVRPPAAAAAAACMTLSECALRRHTLPLCPSFCLCPRPPAACRPAQARGILSFVIDLLWCIFWLAAAGCASSYLADWDQAGSKMKASVAFSWITWWAAILPLPFGLGGAPPGPALAACSTPRAEGHAGACAAGSAARRRRRQSHGATPPAR